VPGEVDAALVYRTDAASTPDVDGVEFAESARAVNDYPVVVLADAPNPEGARAFVAYLAGDAAMAVFTAAAFQPA
jgi:molybdate transport system substrate-binding protein